MQPHAAHSETAAQTAPLQIDRAPFSRRFGLFRTRAGCWNDFSEDHGNGLEAVDLIILIGSFGSVLNRQDADHQTALKDRHAKERMVWVFAGFRPI